MKKLLIVALFLSVVVYPVSVKAQGISFSLSPQIWSKNITERGNISHDGPVLQTDLFITLPRGLYFDVWHSMGLNDINFSSDFGDEVDLTFGWKIKVREFGLHLSIAYFDLFDLKKLEGDLVQFSVEVNKNLKINDANSLTPYLAYRFLVPLELDIANEHRIIYGIKHKWQISPKLALNQKMNLMNNSAVAIFDSGTIGRYEGGLDWKVSKSVIIQVPLVKFSLPITGNDQRETELAYGAGLTFHF